MTGEISTYNITRTIGPALFMYSDTAWLHHREAMIMQCPYKATMLVSFEFFQFNDLYLLLFIMLWSLSMNGGAARTFN